MAERKFSNKCVGAFDCENLYEANNFLRIQKYCYKMLFEEFSDSKWKEVSFKNRLELFANTKKKYEHYRNEISRLGGNISRIPPELNYMEIRN